MAPPRKSRVAGRRYLGGFFFERRVDLLDRHLSDEPEAFARHRANEFLRPAVIADRLARRLDRRAQCRVGDDHALPDLLVEFVLVDQAVAVLDQVAEQVEDPRLDGTGLAFPAQLLKAQVQLAIAETIDRHPVLLCHENYSPSRRVCLLSYGRKQNLSNGSARRRHGGAFAPRPRGMSLRRRIIREKIVRPGGAR